MNTFYSVFQRFTLPKHCGTIFNFISIRVFYFHVIRLFLPNNRYFLLRWVAYHRWFFLLYLFSLSKNIYDTLSEFEWFGNQPKKILKILTRDKLGGWHTPLWYSFFDRIQGHKANKFLPHSPFWILLNWFITWTDSFLYLHGKV